jgi:indoleamine 2,3-dioxygenase
MALSDYQVNPRTGFVASVPLPNALPPAFAAWDQVAPELSALIRARRVRAVMQGLPLLDPLALTTDGDRERALLLLTHFANAHVWGGERPALSIPRSLAVPLCALAAEMERPPIAHYATTTLTNWRLVDEAQPVSVDNARTQIQFLGGVDEDWFFVASMGVELAGAPLIPLAMRAVDCARDDDDAGLAAVLIAFADLMPQVHGAMEHVRTWCDPSTYYLRVRPFVSGWPAPGIAYEGVSDEPRRYIGGSAGQSALLQLFDAMLGVHHVDHPAGAYLRSVRGYMPKPHRTLVELVERDSQVRERALSGSAALRDAFNGAVAQIVAFRHAHMKLAHDYIVAPSGPARDLTGTGGTSLDTFLGAAHRATNAARA